MAQVELREDPMSRIQREIIEVTEREREFREGHFRKNREVTPEGGQRLPKFPLPRATSTPILQARISPDNTAALTTTAILNGHAYKKASLQSSTKGLMQRFIANKGRLAVSPTFNATYTVSSPYYVPSPFNSSISPIHAPTAITVPLEAVQNPIKKRRQPVKEKIASELKEMRDREFELKRMRKKRNSFDSDFSSDSELDEEEDVTSGTGVLKPAKSIGELYSESLSSGHESGDSPKPAKSLAELCELPPGQEFLAVSSTTLIAKWESLIKKNND